MSDFTKIMRQRISNFRDFHGISGEVLKELLNEFDETLDLLESYRMPEESFTITPCFKLSLNHKGEYHEEYFDTEVEAFAAAAKAAAAL